MTNSVDPDQTAPIGAVCSGSTLFASTLNSSVMLGNNLQHFQIHFFLGALRVNNLMPVQEIMVSFLPLSRIALHVYAEKNNMRKNSSSLKSRIHTIDLFLKRHLSFCGVNMQFFHCERAASL